MKQLQDKPFSIALIFLLFIFTLPHQTGQAYAQQEGEEFLAGVPANFPPHYSIDPQTKKPIGFAIDVMDEVAQRSGIKVRYVVYPTWAKTVEAMEKGEVVLIPNIGIIAEREAYMDFTSSVETSDIVVFVRETTIDIKGVEDLKGKEVAVVEMNKGQHLMQERGGSKLQIYASQDEAFLSLISGKSDALVYPKPPINLLSREAGLEDRIKIVGKPLFEVKRGIAVRKGNHELLKRLDDKVKTFIETPRYAGIYAKWYGKPAPYWTIKRVVFLGGGLLAFAIVTLVVWRYLSLLRLNKELQAALTERKQLEESLRVQGRRFEAFFESTITPLAFLDKDFNFIRVNKAYADADEKEISYFPGRNHFELYPSDAKIIFEEVVRTKAPFQVFARPFIYPDHPDRGVTFWDWTLVPIMDNKGEVEFLVFSLVNVTERKKAEELIRSILESVDEGFIIIDRDYRILTVNRAFADKVKMPLENIIGKHCYEISHHLAKPCYEAGEDCAVRHVFETGESHSVIHTHYDAEGNQIYVETKAYTLSKDESGKVMTVIEILIDITEERKLENQLRQSQKMEAIGQLTGGIAHDFNNILTAIIGYASLMQMKMQEDDPLRLNVDQILASSERAAHLTHSLLAFSRKQVLNPKTTDLNNIINNVVKLLKRVIGEDIELEMDLLQEPLTVMADSMQIEQVLMNLATNARDAMPKGGQLTIETKKIELDEEFIKSHGYGEPGAYALMSISDNGVGMDEKTRQRIFEPFFTTKEVGKGTGLGLAMVYGIIKQHNGYINVYSEPDKGTTFKIYLSLVQSEEIKKFMEEEEIMPSRGTETILLAEDDESVRKFTVSVLHEFGYNVIEAVDGEDAVNKFMENKDKIQLLLFDVIMPKKSGNVAYEEIRKVRSDIKVLFSSGYTADTIQRQGLLDEGLEFISKPTAPTALMKKIREVLDKDSAK